MEAFKSKVSDWGKVQVIFQSESQISLIELGHDCECLFYKYFFLFNIEKKMWLFDIVYIYYCKAEFVENYPMLSLFVFLCHLIQTH